MKRFEGEVKLGRVDDVEHVVELLEVRELLLRREEAEQRLRLLRELVRGPRILRGPN